MRCYPAKPDNGYQYYPSDDKQQQQISLSLSPFLFVYCISKRIYSFYDCTVGCFSCAYQYIT